MTSTPFDSDCSSCFGLCCVALSFDRSSQFGHDKPAGQPCHHLDARFRCAIHARREALGYDGCEAFECLGAGQRASALHGGGPWRTDPAAARQMHADFSVLLRLQEMRQALETAETLALDEALDAERRALLARIADRADSQQAGLRRDADVLLAAANGFLRRLRPVVARAV